MNDNLVLAGTAIVVGIVLAIGGIVTLQLARNGERGVLRRNPIAGIRTSLTLSSDEAWNAAHKAAAAHTARAAKGAFAGAIVAALSGLLSMLGVPFPIAMTIFVVATFGSAGWLVGWVLAGAKVGQRAAAQAVSRADNQTDIDQQGRLSPKDVFWHM